MNMVMKKRPDAAPRKKKKYTRQNFYEFLCVVPALVMIGVIAYYPIVDLFRISFTNWNLIRPQYDYVGFTNWKWLVDTWEMNHVYESFIVTLKYTVGHMIIILTVGLALALLFNKMTKGFAFMRAVVFLPHYVAMSTAALIFMVILNERYGIANAVLESLAGIRVNWLMDGSLALLMMIVIASWRAIGYDMLIYLGGMQGISQDYYEAAMLDGANQTQIFFKITLPLLAPTTLFLAVTQFISSMKVYALADVLTAGGPYRATEVIVYLIYTMAFEDYRVDRAAVVAICFFAFLLLITRLTMNVSDRKVNYDA